MLFRSVGLVGVAGLLLGVLILGVGLLVLGRRLLLVLRRLLLILGRLHVLLVGRLLGIGTRRRLLLVLLVWRLLWVVGGRGRVILLWLLVGLRRRVALRGLGEEVELGAGEQEDDEAEGDSAAREAGGVGAGLPGIAWEGEKRPSNHSFLMAAQVLEIPVFSCLCRRMGAPAPSGTVTGPR